MQHLPSQLESLLFYTSLVLYLVSWLIHASAWQGRNDRLAGLAIRILWVGLVSQLSMLILRWYLSGHVPFLTAYEFVNFFAFLVVLMFLLVARKPGNRLLGVFVMPVALALMAYAAFMSRIIEPEIPIFNSMLLKVHVLTTLVAYAAWSITFGASVCFLYLDRKTGENPGLFDGIAYKSAFVAFCLLTLGIISGALWSDRVFGQLWFWDPKETWSFITWLIFMSYLHARYTLNWRGKRAAIMAIVGFAAVIFTYVGVDFLLPQIHGMR